MENTIFVATPSFNSVEYIDRAILSVVSQSGSFKIRYHVQDGGSDDGTVERLKWWVATLASGNFPIQCNGIHMTYESGPDRGMYDALTKAFMYLAAPPDAFETWINSDDTLLPGSFSAVARIAEKFNSSEVAWLSGEISTSDLHGITHGWFHERPPTKGISLGLGDGRFLPFIQQEGTFFRGWLWNKFANEGAFGDLKMAGDWLLWTRFARDAELFYLNQPLGRFHRRAGQLSEDMDAYLGEIDSIVSERDRAIRFLDLLKNATLVNCHLEWDSHTEAFKSSRSFASRSRISLFARRNIPELTDKIKNITGHLEDVALERENYRNLLPGDLIRLIETNQIENLSWKTELIRKPWKVGFWRALRRYQRRNGQNYGIRLSIRRRY